MEPGDFTSYLCSGHVLVQVTVFAATLPSLVGGLNAQDTVNTVVPGGCCTVMTADVNARLVMVSVQFVLAQSGAPAMIGLGAAVFTLKATVPFFTALAGIASEPDTVIGAGF